jgi:Gamma-glutamyltranspeptidase
MRKVEAGGNAVDAGVVAGLALEVLQPDIVWVAGVAPIMLYKAASGQITKISGLGWWPKAADPEYFRPQASRFRCRQTKLTRWFATFSIKRRTLPGRTLKSWVGNGGSRWEKYRNKEKSE